jgi:hypothetical protein
MFAKTTISIFLALCLGSAAADEIDCSAPCNDDGVCIYNVKVNLYASELGYFTFVECGDIINPTIAVEVGKTYKFVQVSDNDVSYSKAGSSMKTTSTHFFEFR